MEATMRLLKCLHSLLKIRDYLHGMNFVWWQELCGDPLFLDIIAHGSQRHISFISYTLTVPEPYTSMPTSQRTATSQMSEVQRYNQHLHPTKRISSTAMTAKAATNCSPLLHHHGDTLTHKPLQDLCLKPLIHSGPALPSVCFIPHGQHILRGGDILLRSLFAMYLKSGLGEHQRVQDDCRDGVGERGAEEGLLRRGALSCGFVGFPASDDATKELEEEESEGGVHGQRDSRGESYT